VFFGIMVAIGNTLRYKNKMLYFLYVWYVLALFEDRELSGRVSLRVLFERL